MPVDELVHLSAAGQHPAYPAAAVVYIVPGESGERAREMDRTLQNGSNNRASGNNYRHDMSLDLPRRLPAARPPRKFIYTSLLRGSGRIYTVGGRRRGRRAGRARWVVVGTVM